jgi:hypothetical protein
MLLVVVRLCANALDGLMKGIGIPPKKREKIATIAINKPVVTTTVAFLTALLAVSADANSISISINAVPSAIADGVSSCGSGTSSAIS